jgi:hypothetical protein
LCAASMMMKILMTANLSSISATTATAFTQNRQYESGSNVIAVEKPPRAGVRKTRQDRPRQWWAHGFAAGSKLDVTGRRHLAINLHLFITVSRTEGSRVVESIVESKAAGKSTSDRVLTDGFMLAAFAKSSVTRN